MTIQEAVGEFLGSDAAAEIETLLAGDGYDEEANYIYTGDPRRCPLHGTVTSSPDGMFDAPCGACEFEADPGFEDFA